MGLFIQKTKFKTDFQDGNCGGHKLLAIFDLRVTLMILTKFQVNWPFGSGEEGENLFSRWPSSWISNCNNLSLFFLPVPLCFLPRLEPIGLSILKSEK